jgi:cytidylate kinase
MKPAKKLTIAIDGPAASGKSTTAKLVAEKLGYLYIDTGAMYRALTTAVLEQKIPATDEKAVNILAKQVDIRLVNTPAGLKTFLNGRDVSKAIRLPQVTQVISQISAYKEIREIMKNKQRQLAREGGVVMDGRDIGTVVLPDADVKIFMDASVEERTQRRLDELRSKGVKIDRKQIREEIVRRDQLDSTRDVAPLKPAPDAHVLDTSDLTVEEQVQRVLTIIEPLLH